MNCKCGGHFTITNVYCDMITDGGGWTVIQRNKKDSRVDFNKNWTDYEIGFGDLNTEFWYGLAAIHCLTQRGNGRREWIISLITRPGPTSTTIS